MYLNSMGCCICFSSKAVVYFEYTLLNSINLGVVVLAYYSGYNLVEDRGVNV